MTINSNTGAKAAARQFLVSFASTYSSQKTPANIATTYWTTKTGGATTATATKVWDGGARFPFVLSGVPETSDLVLSRPYDPAVGQNIMATLQPYVGAWYGTIKVQPTLPDFTVAGGFDQYYGLLTAVTPPDVNAGSSDAAMFSLTFTVSYLTPGRGAASYQA